MKFLRLLSLALPALFASFPAELSARDLAPPYWFEDLSASDGSIHRCLVFRSTAGVGYRVSSSTDLVTWSDMEEIYGLGHEFVVPLIEVTPPSPPGPGEDPPPASSPAIPVSLQLRPSSATGGGTVVSWKSLDHGGPMIACLAEDLDPAWASVPIFAERHGDHYFLVHHPTEPVVPPVENPPMGAGDAVMFAVLEAHLSDMNTTVATSAAVARNTPTPVQDPGERKFVRIHADWDGVDTDGDGSPDWAEFEIAGNPSHPWYALANAFSGDADGNGIPDGQQLDADSDGVPDAADIAPGDNSTNQQKIALPRYAVFPIGVSPLDPLGNPRTPLQINNRGTVLYKDGVWTGGAWKPLSSTGSSLEECKAAAINDGGEIVGSGVLTLPTVGQVTVAVRWPDENQDPQVISQGTGDETIYATPTGASSGAGPLFSNDGRLVAINAKVEPDVDEILRFNLKERSLWTLPGSGRTVASVPVGDTITHVKDSGTYWGSHPGPGNGIAAVVAGAITEIPSQSVRNIVTPAGGNPHAFIPGRVPQTLKAGAWKSTASTTHGIDMADDGTAISDKTGPNPNALRLNGKWTPLARTIPEAAAWHGAGLSDTTPDGWILAARHDGGTPPHAALLPLRVEGNLEIGGTVLTESVGVDAFSLGSTEPGPAVQDKIWIMAPGHGGETRVKITAPVHSSAPVELSGAGLLFNGSATSVNLTGKVTEFTVKADNTAVSGSEIPLVMKLGGGDDTAQSASTPIAVKVMKRRTVNVQVWLVPGKNANGTASHPFVKPTKAELDSYLNDLYLSQLNANFNCTVTETPPVDYDTADGTAFGAPADKVKPRNNYLDTNAGGQEFATIRNAHYDATANINLYIVGGAIFIQGHAWLESFQGLLTPAPAVGAANPLTRSCVALSNVLVGNTPARLKDTIAHEIGHIIFGPGHPDEAKKKMTNGVTEWVDGGPAPLPGTEDIKRLMCSGGKRKKDATSRLIVKGEWDKAEQWFTIEENNDRM